MTEQELRELIAANESDRIELTISTNDTDKFSEAVCAFANDLPDHKQPGYLIIGVNSQRNIVGTPVTDELLRNLAALREAGNVQPLPSIVIEKVPTSDGDVAVVTVQPSLLPPVRYKGRVCIRLGPRRGYATDQEERRLTEKRVSSARTFDLQPCLGSTLEDLVQRIFTIDYLPRVVSPEVIEENGRTVKEQLASLRFYDLGRDCPTHAGILLFGFDVQRWLPGAYVQLLRAAGTSLTDPIVNEREIGGDLLSLLSRLDAHVDANTQQAPAGRSTLREDTLEDYPQIAIRELLMNAVMHRDYASTAPIRVSWFDDRIEIQSPGGLYGEASRENFPRQPSYRNPVIAEAMKALGYVNRFGRGVLRAQEALLRNGNPEAIFEFDSGYVLATIRRAA